MFYWIYSLPVWLFFVMFIGAFCGFAVLGVRPGRSAARRVFDNEPAWRGVVQILLESSVAFYSLLVALIAVATYENYATASQKVFRESSALGTLYRDVSNYPEPERSELTDALRRYTRYVVDEAWPQQRQGIVPEKGVSVTSAFQDRLYAFEPDTERERLLHESTVRKFNDFADARRDRLLSVTVHLPGLLWGVLICGMLVSIALTWLLPVQKALAHATVCCVYALVSSLMLCLVAAMDHPYRGAFSVSPHAFELLLRTLMNSER